MEYDYTECKTCARKGDTFCIGCQPMMIPGGTFTRSRYTQTKDEFHITSQSDTIGGNDDEHQGFQDLQRKWRNSK